MGEEVDPEAPDAADLATDRRGFLRSMGRSTVRSTVEVAAALDAVRRAPARLISSLDFDPDEGADGEATMTTRVAPTAPMSDPAGETVEDRPQPLDPPMSDDGRLRRSHHLDADGIRILDQRELPGREHELFCPSAASVAAAIQAFAVGGGPIVGEVGAEAIALAARSADGSTDDRDRSRLGWTIGLLRSARPSSGYLKAALDSVEQLIDDQTDSGLTSLASRAAMAADRVIAELADACDRLAMVGVANLAAGSGRLRVLTLGATGEMSGGRIGTVTGILEACNRARPVHAWIAESRPTLLGARIGTLELEQVGVPYGLIADSAAASLMAAGEVDVVLVAAERIAGNGDVAALAGTYPLAVLAQRHGIPFHVCATREAFDGSIPDGSGCPTEQLPLKMLTSYRGERIAATAGEARVPWLDVTPSELIASFLVDDGSVS